MLIAVLNCGTSSLKIAYRVEEAGASYRIYESDVSHEVLVADGIAGIIISGSADSVYDEDECAKCDPAIFDLGIPVLGICYGMQLTAHLFGGSVERAPAREYGRVTVHMKEKTGLLDGCKRGAARLNRALGRYRATAVVSIPAGMVACNQTLAILLTEQLCRDHYENKGDLALDLEDSAAITSPLIPWCIAGAVPLAMVGAPRTALLLAVYLWLIPLLRSLRRRA